MDIIHQREWMIECKNISMTFDEGGLVVPVLKDINLKVATSDQIAIVGASGSGKSTLLHILGGLTSPSAGTVRIQGQDLSSLSDKEKGTLRNSRLGFVYQFHHLLPEFTALENVAMPLLIRKTDHEMALQEANLILQKVGLNHRTHHKPAELSGGERQRVAIARALVTKPGCIMADEPTGNLDVETSKSVHDLVLELNQESGTSLIVVTHDRVFAKNIGKVYQLSQGTLQPVK